MTTYQGEKYLKEQLDSLFMQDHTDWHLTVSDDGSDDGTNRIIDEYSNEYPDRISVYRSGIHFGTASTHYMHLLRNCEAEYIMFCDQDDIWHKDKIKKTYERMKEEETAGKAVLIFSDLAVTDEELHPLAPSIMSYQDQDPTRLDLRELVFRNVITGNTVMINKALRDLAVKCTNDEEITMHDWWLGITASRFGKISYIDEALVDYRQHDRNEIGVRKIRSISYVADNLKNIPKVKKAVLARKRQAAVFLKSYGEMLSEDDRVFLKGLVKEHSGTDYYLRYRKNIDNLMLLAGMIVYGY